MQPGDYIHQNKIIDPDIVKTYNIKQPTEEKHYFALSISGKEVEVVETKGHSSFAEIYEYGDVATKYTITLIPGNEIRRSEILRTVWLNGLESKYTYAIKYQWHGKEYIQKQRRIYFNGKEFVDNTDYHDSLEDYKK